MEPQSFIFIGRAGAGKGTQAKHLIEALAKANQPRPVMYVETGAEFRKFIKTDTYTAKLSRAVVESGGLMPEYMPIYLWAGFFVNHYTGAEHIVFDGTPRKLLEAQTLDSLFPFYKLGKPWVIYLDIEHEESVVRLTKRAVEGRKDDSSTAIEKRRIAYERDVKPTVDFYRSNPNVNFLDIDGERPIEVIHADIVKCIGL